MTTDPKKRVRTEEESQRVEKGSDVGLKNKKRIQKVSSDSVEVGMNARFLCS